MYATCISIGFWFQVGVEHSISGIPRRFYFSMGDSHDSFMISYIRFALFFFKSVTRTLTNHYVVVRSVTYLDPTAFPATTAIIYGPSYPSPTPPRQPHIHAILHCCLGQVALVSPPECCICR